jgi:HSP20 family protein
MAQNQTENRDGDGKQQALTRRSEQQQQLARPSSTTREVARTSPVSTMRRMFDELEAGMFGWSPASMMRRMLDDMERIFDTDFFEDVGRSAREYRWSPPVEVRQREDKLVISVDLPGMSQDQRDQIDITVQGSSLVIEGERTRSGEAGDVSRSERPYGRFRRVLSLPDHVDPDQVNARFENGVLEITVPLPPSQITRRIVIRTGRQPEAANAQTQAEQPERQSETH